MPVKSGRHTALSGGRSKAVGRVVRGAVVTPGGEATGEPVRGAIYTRVTRAREQCGEAGNDVAINTASIMARAAAIYAGIERAGSIPASKCVSLPGAVRIDQYGHQNEPFAA